MDPIQKVMELYAKYESNDYMLNRLNSHIFCILPNTLEIENEHYNERILRTNTLQSMQETFIKVFLDKHKYYHIPSSGHYYEYADDIYTICKEDDIHYKLLSTISEDRSLMDWKYKTKSSIMKRIKERHLLSSTPSTTTIQRILNSLCPLIFPSKSATKYFLTVLGDNILKKQTPIRIINKHASIFFEMDRIGPYIGVNNLTHNFTSKYNENHVFSQYRLLVVNDPIPSEFWVNLINKRGLDMLCVAAHYSNRYSSSEQYINSVSELKSHVMYLQSNSQEMIVSKFIEHSTQPASDSFRITWKQLHYIWKQYLVLHDIPNMIYSNSLKQMFKQVLKYEEENDSFVCITSKYLPNISQFIQFWEENIICAEDELEIGELYILYSSTNIKENDLPKLIQHFFPETTIADNKYIMNVKCKLWNKQQHIVSLIDSYKQCPPSDIISIDDLYTDYTNTIKSHLVVSKQYFEKYIRFNLTEYIVYDSFVNFIEV